MEKFLKIFLSLLLLISLAMTVFIFKGESDSNQVNIYINSKLYKKVDLSKVSSPYKIALPHNTLLIESDGVTMLSADCPDKVCVSRGKMSGGTPIICAPNSVYITFDKEADAVSW